MTVPPRMSGSSRMSSYISLSESATIAALIDHDLGQPCRAQSELPFYHFDSFPLASEKSVFSLFRCSQRTCFVFFRGLKRGTMSLFQITKLDPMARIIIDVLSKVPCLDLQLTPSTQEIYSFANEEGPLTASSFQRART